MSDTDNNEKIPLVLMSGGLDSTTLLYRNLMGSDDTDVDILYVDGYQHGAKRVAEQRAIRKITRWFADHSKERHIRKMNNLSIGQDYIGVNTKFSQMNHWMFGALMMINGNRHSRLEIGTVAGDGINLYQHSMEEAWKHLQYFTKIGDPVPLATPLALWDKFRLIDELPLELLDLVWVCELPVDENGVGVEFTHEAVEKLEKDDSIPILPCGLCTSCVDHEMALQEAILRKQKKSQLPLLMKRYRTIRKKEKDHSTKLKIPTDHLVQCGYPDPVNDY
jgi:7-cyano-7-deazaguanine synthase in queuosine biosynthesis